MVYIEVPCHVSDLPSDLREELLVHIRSSDYYRNRVDLLVEEEITSLIKDRTDVDILKRILYRYSAKTPACPKIKLGLFVQAKTKTKIEKLLRESYKVSPLPTISNSILCIDMCCECKNEKTEAACGVQSVAGDSADVKAIESILSDWLRQLGENAYALAVRRWKELYSDESILAYCEKERVIYRPKMKHSLRLVTD